MKIKIPVYSKQIEKMLVRKNNNKERIIFKALSKISSLYSLTLHNNISARYRLFMILNDLQKISLDLDKYLKQNTIKEEFSFDNNYCFEVYLSNSINHHLLEVIKKLDNACKYDKYIEVVTGKRSMNSTSHKYFYEIQREISKIACMNITDIKTKKLNEVEKDRLQHSYDYLTMPSPFNLNNK